MEIKIRLLRLGKKHKDLLGEIRKRGYPGLSKTQLSIYINRKDTGPQSQRVMEVIYKILEEWESGETE